VYCMLKSSYYVLLLHDDEIQCNECGDHFGVFFDFFWLNFERDF